MTLERWRDQHPLEGPFIKLKRAEKHLDEIDRLNKVFVELDPHGVSSQLNADKTFYECRLHAIFPPFLDFWTYVGEFCYQVRSSLDHIIYALSVFPDTLSKRDRTKAEKDTGFPISLMRTVNDSSIKGRLTWVPTKIYEAVFRVVDDEQPYQRGDSLAAFDDPLALLDELGNLDKHRLFKLLPVSLSINLEGLAPGIKTISSGSTRDGDIFAWVPADLDPKVDFYPRVSAKVCLPVTRHGELVHVDSLGVIHRRVRYEILPRFKEFFGPLPPSVQI